MVKTPDMQEHHHTGFEGEAMAINWLSSRGFFILRTNWRYSHYELDIIAEKGEMLYFIEVKTRKNLGFGYPEESVSGEKLRRMKMAGAGYLQRYAPDRIRVQYAIVSILTLKDQEPELTFIEDIG